MIIPAILQEQHWGVLITRADGTRSLARSGDSHVYANASRGVARTFARGLRREGLNATPCKLTILTNPDLLKKKRRSETRTRKP